MKQINLDTVHYYREICHEIWRSLGSKAERILEVPGSSIRHFLHGDIASVSEENAASASIINGRYSRDLRDTQYY